MNTIPFMVIRYINYLHGSAGARANRSTLLSCLSIVVLASACIPMEGPGGRATTNDGVLPAAGQNRVTVQICNSGGSKGSCNQSALSNAPPVEGSQAQEPSRPDTWLYDPPVFADSTAVLDFDFSLPIGGCVATGDATTLTLKNDSQSMVILAGSLLVGPELLSGSLPIFPATDVGPGEEAQLPVNWGSAVAINHVNLVAVQYRHVIPDEETEPQTLTMAIAFVNRGGCNRRADLAEFYRSQLDALPRAWQTSVRNWSIPRNAILVEGARMVLPNEDRPPQVEYTDEDLANLPVTSVEDDFTQYLRRYSP